MEHQGRGQRFHALATHGIQSVNTAWWNLSTPALYEHTIQRREGLIAHLGPLVVRTGQYTGRSPNDKYVVREPSSQDLIITEMAWHSLFARSMFLQEADSDVLERHVPQFTVMNYLLAPRGVLAMHCSANHGKDDNDVAIFFGLSGTGKTILSADGRSRLRGQGAPDVSGRATQALAATLHVAGSAGVRRAGKETGGNVRGQLSAVCRRRAGRGASRWSALAVMDSCRVSAR